MGTVGKMLPELLSDMLPAELLGLKLPIPKKAKSEADMRRAYRAPDFSLKNEYLRALRVIFYAVTFSAVAPWTMFISGVGLLLLYIRVAFCLATRYNKPPMLGDAVAQMTEMLLPVSLLGHYAGLIFLLIKWTVDPFDEWNLGEPGTQGEPGQSKTWTELNAIVLLLYILFMSACYCAWIYWGALWAAILRLFLRKTTGCMKLDKGKDKGPYPYGDLGKFPLSGPNQYCAWFHHDQAKLGESGTDMRFEKYTDVGQATVGAAAI